MQAMSSAYAAIDGLVKPLVFRTMEKYGLHITPQTHLTKHLPLVESPTPLLLCLAAYLLIVGLGLATIRPADASKKAKGDPLWLRTIVLGHNVVLVALSLYMCLRIVYEAIVVNGYNVWGNAYQGVEKERMLAHTIWVFYVSKLYEFNDTFIMLLKGNIRQVSFLHVYHHATISFIWWAITFHAPGGDSYFSAALNSWVHVLMYAYYFLAATLPKDPAVRKRWLFWGKYLTMFQMAQFAANFAQGIYVYSFNTYHRGLSALLCGYMASLLALFGHFFVQKHIVDAGKAKKAA